MIGLDTNVVVRLFVDDDMRQARAARAFVSERCTRENPGYVNRVTLSELVWVLASVYRFDRTAVADVVERLLATDDIHVEDHSPARSALDLFRSATGIDFADALVGEINLVHGCATTATFDRKAARLDGFMAIG